MEPFIRHTGTAAPLRRSNVDTDQIIPAEYLKRITRDGFEDGLFSAWRKDPDFVLNRDEYQGVSILVAGPDFGTGSSREHAVWPQNYGFCVVCPIVSPISSAKLRQGGLDRPGGPKRHRGIVDAHRSGSFPRGHGRS